MALVKPAALCGKALVFNRYLETQLPSSTVRTCSSGGACHTDAELFIPAATVPSSLCHGSISDS